MPRCKILLGPELADEVVAQTIQLSIKYDPAPPFDSGHPDRAPGPAKATLFRRYEKMRDFFARALPIKP